MTVCLDGLLRGSWFSSGWSVNVSKVEWNSLFFEQCVIRSFNLWKLFLQARNSSAKNSPGRCCPVHFLNYWFGVKSSWRNARKPARWILRCTDKSSERSSAFGGSSKTTVEHWPSKMYLYLFLEKGNLPHFVLPQHSFGKIVLGGL
jgi:hypothetical protein